MGRSCGVSIKTPHSKPLQQFLPDLHHGKGVVAAVGEQIRPDPFPFLGSCRGVEHAQILQRSLGALLDRQPLVSHGRDEGRENLLERERTLEVRVVEIRLDRCVQILDPVQGRQEAS